MASDPKQLLAELSSDLASADLSNNAQREALLLKTKQLTYSLERDRDSIYRIYRATGEAAGVTVAIDMGLYKAVAEAEGPVTAEELARTAPGHNVNLIRRIMRHVAAYGTVAETEAGYVSNNITKSLAQEECQYAMRHVVEVCGLSWMYLPAHLRRTNFQEPTDPKHTAFSLAKNMDGSGSFEVMASTPSLEMTNKWFRAINQNFRPWHSVYPLLDRWPHSSEPGIFVDVGGNLGHQAVGMKRAFPQLLCRYIVEDQESMIADSSHLAEHDVEFLAHDFFTPQPVRGATIYYLRYIIHDWPDAECITILSHLRDAMMPGYSKILLNEYVIPEMHVNPFHTGADLAMMAITSGRERTVKEYIELLNKAGLEVTGLFRDDTAVINHDVLEAMVARE